MRRLAICIARRVKNLLFHRGKFRTDCRRGRSLEDYARGQEGGRCDRAPPVIVRTPVIFESPPGRSILGNSGIKASLRRHQNI